MTAYLLGLATLPALAVLGAGALYVHARTLRWLERRWGINFEVKWRRDVNGISDYVLRNNIWWERAFGPVFAGGWHRPSINGPLFTRWLGVGSVDGPCVMAFRKRVDVVSQPNP